MVLWGPTRTSTTKTKKRCLFHHRGLDCKSRKSTDTWSNRQVWPWSTNWSRAKVNEFCQENTLVITNTHFQQSKRQLCTWTSPDGQYQNQIDCILCNRRWRSSIQSAKPGAECGWDHKLLTAKFRFKLKTVRKTTRPFSYEVKWALRSITTNKASGSDGIPTELF